MSVVLYHQQTCPQCKMVESLLNKNNIAYESCMDIEFMSAKGVRTTPTLEVDGNFLKGKQIVEWIKQQ